jgi:hypothetical protein
MVMCRKGIMGEYKRLISYIYSYDRGIKDKNVGFAKIESRNGVCKVNISIKVADELMGIKREQREQSENILEVYFFYRFGNRVKKILLEKMVVNNGTGIAKLKMGSENIGNQQVSINDIAGIFLCRKSFWTSEGIGDVIYASEWDDIPVRLDDFIEREILEENDNKILQEYSEVGYNRENIPEEQEQSIVEISASEVESIVSDTGNITDGVENISGDTGNITDGVENISGDTGNVTDGVENIYCDLENRQIEKCEIAEHSDEEEFIRPDLDEEMAEGELQSILNEKRGPNAGDYFKMLCGCYPKVKVAEIEGECIKITPHDISYLPKKYWSLCNNSFLLHGYYSYKYLLLCEKKVAGEKKYLICVPGLYHQKEQRVAGMFGFTEFEGDKNKDIMNFGYWCMYL